MSRTQLRQRATELRQRGAIILAGLKSSFVMARELNNPVGLLLVKLGISNNCTVRFRRIGNIVIPATRENLRSGEGYPFEGKVANIARTTRSGLLTSAGNSLLLRLGGDNMRVDDLLSEPVHFAIKLYDGGRGKRRVTAIGPDWIRFEIASSDSPMLVFVGVQSAFQNWGMESVVTHPYPSPKSGERHFLFEGQQYPYFYHVYNTTWTNERSIEIPIVLQELRRPGLAAAGFVEIGNVLKHYFTNEHLVIDKYESGPGVVNQDVLDYAPKARYKLVVSISTLEHVGFDAPEHRRADAFRVATRNIVANYLEPKGRMLTTVPLGYNPSVDEFLRRGDFFDSVSVMERGGTFPDEVGWRHIDGFPGWEAAQFLPTASPPKYIAVCKIQVSQKL